MSSSTQSAKIQSPASPVRRKLHARHGSLSAPDPLNVHAPETASPRVAASRLSIVSIPANDITLDALVDRPTSPTSPGRVGQGGMRSIHFPSTGARSRQRSDSSGSLRNRSMSPGRLSFAQSSFAAPGVVSGPQSPTIAPAHRRRTSSTSAIYHPSHPRLTADQIYDLARVTCNPVAVADTGNAHTFQQLSADEFLPFIDRPAEVGSLLVEGKGARLLQMILQLLPFSAAGMFYVVSCLLYAY